VLMEPGEFPWNFVREVTRSALDPDQERKDRRLQKNRHAGKRVSGGLVLH